MTKRSEVIASSVLLASLFASTTFAVTVSPDGRGQVLLYPYYTAQGTNDTVISVVNTTDADKVLKLRLLEGRNGRPVLSLNLYLAARDGWSAAIARNGAGQPVLRVYDASCTVPILGASPTVAGAREVTLSNAAYAGYDRAGSGVDRAKEGYVELLEMGEVAPGFRLPGGGTMSEAMTWYTRDCGALAAAWEAGGAFDTSGGAELTRPKGGLIGSAAVINVQDGTDYTYDPVVLNAVFSARRHTAPGDERPSLADADPVSLVVAEDQAFRSTWSNGADAVSAVLMHPMLFNEYSVESALGAATDLVVTFPTKPFHVVRESDTAAVTRAPFTARFDDVLPLGYGVGGAAVADGASTGACESISITRTAREGEHIAPIDFGVPPPGYVPDPWAFCWTANIMSFGDVLSSVNSVSVDYHSAQQGWFEANLGLWDEVRTLTSSEGHRYRGLPIVGFAVQKFVNGNLRVPESSGTVLSNYGGTAAHKYMTVVEQRP